MRVLFCNHVWGVRVPNGKQDNVHGTTDIRNPFVIGEQYDRETTQAWEAVMDDPGAPTR